MPFHVAVSGVKAATADLSVIGNNIANANTSGFKQSRAEFADVYSIANLGIAKETPGSGVRLSRTAQQFTQGNIAVTENNLDLAINGGGFFMLDDNGSRIYTRSGNFGIDREGYVVNADQKKLVTYQVDNNGKVVGTLSPLKLSTADLPPKMTSKAEIGLNLDSGAKVPLIPFDPTDATSYNYSTATSLYDSLGASHTANMYYRKTADNTWETTMYVDNTSLGTDTLNFTPGGAMDLVNGAALPLAFDKTFTPTGGGSPMTVTFDYATATQYGSASSVNRLTQNGYTTGQLSGLDVDKRGVIYGRFTNGQSQVQGQVAIASFANTQGLLPQGDTNWAETFASGQPLIGEPGTSERGLVQSGALEESNVDLSAELVKLIVAQRNFQANTQVIKADDTVTQAIINIR
jgi:flagellar hook protein FlgE